MIRTIVCIASVGQQSAPTAFDYSYSLAASRGAHLTLVAVAPKFRAPSGMVIPEVRALLSEANSERKQAAEHLLATSSGMAGVTTQPIMVHDHFSETFERVLRLARPSDLVIAMIAQDTLMGEPDLVQQSLFATGRPVLLLPQAWSYPAIMRRIVVAWDGGAKAARAVGDALALISAAEHVEIICVGPESGKTLNGGDVASHLSRHCTSVSVVEMPAGPEGVGHTIQTHAVLTRADLVVMGAYGHSRLAEFLLGGATKCALDAAQVPTLLSY